MATFAVMVIWFGAGRFAQFDTQRYDSLAECEAVKAVIVEVYSDWDAFIPPNDIRCIEVKRP